MTIGIELWLGSSQGSNWYQSLVEMCGCSLEKAMVGSHVEDVSEQDRGRDPSPPTQGRKNKSRDTISNFEG